MITYVWIVRSITARCASRVASRVVISVTLDSTSSSKWVNKTGASIRLVRSTSAANVSHKARSNVTNVLLDSSSAVNLATARANCAPMLIVINVTLTARTFVIPVSPTINSTKLQVYVNQQNVT